MAANITNVDLNLLVVLQVVLAERSATRAAERLHVTQSAVSNALTRLRAVFDDPLVMRNARGLSPTPRALALQPALDALVADTARVLEQPAVFDAATTTREFSLACADYYSAVVVPRLIERLRARAPRATLRVRSLEELVTDHGLERDVDVHIGIPPKMPSGCLSTVLFEDRFVCLARTGTLKKGTRRLTLKAFLEASHVRISVLGRARDPVDTLLEAQGVTRTVALVVPYFSVVPFVVHESGLMATMSLRLAAAYAASLPIDLIAPPLELPDYGVKMIWHRRTNADEGARFFRALLQEVMGEARAPV